MIEAMPFLPGLSPVQRKSLTASQDAGNLTSNGGLIVLREVANRSGVANVVARHLPDTRNPLLITHTYTAMVTARMMCITAGYPDADDLDALRHDPALLIACNRAPEGGHDIPSQPTISRLENVADVKSTRRRRTRSCSMSTTPTISCTAASSSRCSTRTLAATASSRC